MSSTPHGRAERWPPLARVALGLGVTLFVLGALPPFVPPIQADPVRTVFISPDDQTAGKFLSDLSTWWRFRDIPSSDRLVVQAVRGERRRLHEVDRGQGDFALVSVGAMVRHQQAYPAVAVVAVLWPSYLHVLTRNPAPSELGWPLEWTLRIASDAAYVQDTLHAFLRQEAALADATAGQALADRPLSSATTLEAPTKAAAGPSATTGPGSSLAADGGQAEPHVPELPLPDWMLPAGADALADLDEAIVLLSLPLPAPQLLAAAAATGGPPLRLLPLSAELLDELKLNHAWLLLGGMQPKHYPFLGQGMEVPVAFTVVVARRDLPLNSARKMLLGLYEYTSQAALVNPLFAQVDKANLKLFNGIAPLHPATRTEYGLREPAGTVNGAEPPRPPLSASPAQATWRPSS